jgi:hypothetical protein
MDLEQMTTVVPLNELRRGFGTASHLAEFGSGGGDDVSLGWLAFCGLAKGLFVGCLHNHLLLRQPQGQTKLSA